MRGKIMIKFEECKENFRGNSGNFLVRCPSCMLENYGPNVVTGTCTWCGWSEEVEKLAETIKPEVKDV